MELITVKQGFNIQKSISVTHHIKRMKKGKNKMIPIDAEMAFDKIEHFKKLLTVTIILEHNKSHIWKVHNYHYTQGECQKL